MCSDKLPNCTFIDNQIEQNFQHFWIGVIFSENINLVGYLITSTSEMSSLSPKYKWTFSSETVIEGTLLT